MQGVCVCVCVCVSVCVSVCACVCVSKFHFPSYMGSQGHPPCVDTTDITGMIGMKGPTNGARQMRVRLDEEGKLAPMSRHDVQVRIH